MRTKFKTLAVACLAAVALASCTKEVKEPIQDEISDETLAKIEQLGFRTQDVQRTDGGYLVEGDIILSEENLNEKVTSPVLRSGNEEQYRTNNLVTGLPRQITVSVSGSVSSTFLKAVDAAIGRYNAENLQLTFRRVSSGGSINIRLVNTNQYIASAGFPSGGRPYGTINYAKRYSTYSLNFMTTVIAHEIGHCIGFRHTDYMDRSYSCGGSYYNEGASSVGAVFIPNTATGPDPNSWMLACLSSTTNRPFNANDKIALDYLY